MKFTEVRPDQLHPLSEEYGPSAHGLYFLSSTLKFCQYPCTDAGHWSRGEGDRNLWSKSTSEVRTPLEAGKIKSVVKISLLDPVINKYSNISMAHNGLSKHFDTMI